MLLELDISRLSQEKQTITDRLSGAVDLVRCKEEIVSSQHLELLQMSRHNSQIEVCHKVNLLLQAQQ